MAEPSPDAIVDSPAASPSDPRAARRRFLVQLGLLAGAGAIPFLGRAVSAGRARPTRLETARPALGTWVRVVAVDGDESRAARGIERAFAAIARVDRQMSIHRPDSQLARVNAAAGVRAVAVDADVIDVVSRACDGARRTGGIYDPTVLPLMRLYGFYDGAREGFPSDRAIADALGRTGTHLVALDRGAGTLGLTRRGAGLDLGSIGKGWALDRAIDALRAEGIGAGLVDVGGNVYAMGTPDEHSSGWSIGVAHPVTGAVDRRFTLRDEAIATSGNAEQSHRMGARLVGHLLDARGGRPAKGPLSATVRARTGVDSDRCSTVAFLLGPGRFGGFPGALEAHFIG
ncbi:MAG TPA: FAD:protein FMN transferase [Candidatus Eisenbacteria bacterium]|nr:FAD:protein FMN transferase [Candidatus Eisenbacteria bacterium]